MEDILSRYNNEEYWSRDIIEAYEQKKRFADIVIPVYYAKDDNGKITIDEEEMTNDFEIEFGQGGSDPANGNEISVDYDIDSLGWFEVFVTGTNGSLNATQITAIEDYVEEDLKSAGIQFTVSQPSYISVTVTGTITYSSGYTESTIETAIETKITDYITNLDLGDDVLFTQIVSQIMSVEGVTNATSINIGGGGATDYVIGTSEKALAGTISLTF